VVLLFNITPEYSQTLGIPIWFLRKREFLPKFFLYFETFSNEFPAVRLLPLIEILKLLLPRAIDPGATQNSQINS